MGLIDQIYTKNPAKGVRRIGVSLQNDYAERVNHKRVHRLMQLMGIEAVYPKPNTSKPNKLHRIYPYLLKGLSATHANHIWGVDITYIKVNGCWMYLYAILDWYSRYVVGWELSDTMETGFCSQTLQRALMMAKPDIHNSDQGSQFTSEEYLLILQAIPTIAISMDSVGRAMDNIFTERLWRTVKYEEVYLKNYQSPREARESLAAYLEYYNHKREHSSLAYQTPATIYFG